uniref:Uncharacterized protein n=1 Tax=Sphaerodactylus townsendi TaxID=933632 RepID=A0ACB8FRI1_9SAUR
MIVCRSTKERSLPRGAYNLQSNPRGGKGGVHPTNTLLLASAHPTSRTGPPLTVDAGQGLGAIRIRAAKPDPCFVRLPREEQSDPSRTIRSLSVPRSSAFCSAGKSSCPAFTVLTPVRPGATTPFGRPGVLERSFEPPAAGSSALSAAAPPEKVAEQAMREAEKGGRRAVAQPAACGTLDWGRGEEKSATT